MAEEEQDSSVSTSQANASLTQPIRAGEVKKGMMVMLKGFPCKVIEVTTSKTGKHGHAKANITGIDIFTGAKKVDISPTSHTMTQPVVTMLTLTLTDISDDGYATTMDDNGSIREDLKMPTEKSPDPELGSKLKTALEEGKDVMVVVTCAPEKDGAKEASQVITAMKIGTGDD